MRQNQLYSSGRISLTPSSWSFLPLRLVECPQQVRQPQQVGGLEGRPPSRHDDGWIRRDNIRPRRRQRVELVVLVEEPDPVLAPIVPEVEQLKLAAMPGVKWVGDAEKSLPFWATGCYRRRTPRAPSRIL